MPDNFTGLKIFTTITELQEFLTIKKNQSLSIGLVPTMGALHEGHISLIDIANSKADVVVSTIFVNPTQFNNKEDLLKYPRPVAKDIAMLEKAGCDLLFFPAVEEMYAGKEPWHFNIGYLEKLYEGAARPGHYQGVTQIVSKLFDAVKPDIAFFGQKDYQQFLVISKLVTDLSINVQLFLCPIIRETDGLAMSSRNIHLKGKNRQNALCLSKALNQISKNYGKSSLNELKDKATLMFSNIDGVTLDYLEFADKNSLLPLSNNQLQEHHFPALIVLVAAIVGETRLIDNVILS